MTDSQSEETDTDPVMQMSEDELLTRKAYEKPLKIFQSNVNYSLYEIRFEGGGEVPKALKGQFTSPVLAQKRIYAFLNDKGKDAKVVVDHNKEARLYA